MSTAILERLEAVLPDILPAKIASTIKDEIRSLLRHGVPPDNRVVDVLSKTTARIIDAGRGQGLLIILDEVGKFLEYASSRSQTHDIFLLQSLAEAACRSGDKPIFLVCLLHQGFNAYTDQLTQTSQREWEKIAGRLEEIAFNHPLDQVMLLIESALSVKVDALPGHFRTRMTQTMAKAVELGWYGATLNQQALVKSAVGLFPIDPFVLPVLLRTFHRFGQNERSLFSYIYSFEPFGLRAFASRPLHGAEPYRLHDLYDYVRANFGHRLAVISYRSRWSVIESVVESFVSEDQLEVEILKTVGILNLINSDDLLPTQERLEWSVAGIDADKRKRVRHALPTLKKRGVLHFRGDTRGYCLWPYTSVDIERCCDEARRQIPNVTGIANAIADQLDASPVVARRHYIKTGNLRYFHVKYSSVADTLGQPDKTALTADGQIVVMLCETEDDRRKAIDAAKQTRSDGTQILLTAIPQPLEKLSGLVLEAQRWDWVASNTPELNSDPYARDEVSRYRACAQNSLKSAIQDYVGLTRLTNKNTLTWFHDGKELRLESGRNVLSTLSDLCDHAYCDAPRLRNELVNRSILSSAAAAARMRLIEAMFARPGEKLLGMPEERKPPEMSMYLSVLKASGLHRQVKGQWVLVDPPHGDPCHLRPALKRIRDLIKQKPDARVSVQTIFRELRRPPYGLRDGVIPVLLAVIAVSQEQEVALYENGTFLREIGKDAFLRMTKAPENFDIQYCKIEGLRSEVFNELARMLELPVKPGKAPELLHVVKQLCLFVAQLPEYVRNTKRLSKGAQAVRDAILAAREPIRLVFHDLPVASAGQRIETGSRMTSSEVTTFITHLKSSLSELREAFPSLQSRMQQSLRSGFGLPFDVSEDCRADIAKRAERLLMNISEPKLKAFCLRLMDDNLPESDWLESVGSYLALRPPSKWRDEEEDLFERELAVLIGRFKRVESAVFTTKNQHSLADGVRIAVTKATGEERQEVVYLNKEDEESVELLRKDIEAIISKRGRSAVVAVCRALWKHLAATEES